MPRLSRLLVALLLAAAALVLTQSPATAACSCRADAGIKQLAQRADVVMRGTLLEQRVSRQNRVYAFEVERIYRGRVAETPAEVVSPRRAADCGLGSLRVDRAYVVFAAESGRRLSSGRCDGTRPADPAYVERVEGVLGSGNPLPPDESSGPTDERPEVAFTPVDEADPPELSRLAAPGVALTLVGLLGLLVFRRRG